MAMRSKPNLLAWLGMLAFLICPAHGQVAQSQSPRLREESVSRSRRKPERPLTAREGKSVVAVAMNTRPRRSERDCSHLVHGIYGRAGLPYSYADSDDLYSGIQGFARVARPQPGDIIVWHGHAGIVVRPSRHLFFSFLSRGPGLDNYRSRYWIARGEPRFYRYIKNDPCPGCRPS